MAITGDCKSPAFGFVGSGPLPAPCIVHASDFVLNGLIWRRQLCVDRHKSIVGMGVVLHGGEAGGGRLAVEGCRGSGRYER